jgi:hypothetical protein
VAFRPGQGGVEVAGAHGGAVMGHPSDLRCTRPDGFRRARDASKLDEGDRHDMIGAREAGHGP